LASRVLEAKPAPSGAQHFTAASFGKNSISYAKLATAGTSKYSGTTDPGFISMIKERLLLQNLGVSPTTKNLKSAAEALEKKTKEREAVVEHQRLMQSAPTVRHSSGKGKQKTAPSPPSPRTISKILFKDDEDVSQRDENLISKIKSLATPELGKSLQLFVKKQKEATL
jgi:hypothetical protein